MEKQTSLHLLSTTVNLPFAVICLRWMCGVCSLWYMISMWHDIYCFINLKENYSKPTDTVVLHFHASLIDSTGPHWTDNMYRRTPLKAARELSKGTRQPQQQVLFSVYNKLGESIFQMFSLVIFYNFLANKSDVQTQTSSDCLLLTRPVHHR